MPRGTAIGVGRPGHGNAIEARMGVVAAIQTTRTVATTIWMATHVARCGDGACESALDGDGEVGGAWVAVTLRLGRDRAGGRTNWTCGHAKPRSRSPSEGHSLAEPRRNAKAARDSTLLATAARDLSGSLRPARVGLCVSLPT